MVFYVTVVLSAVIFTCVDFYSATRLINIMYIFGLQC
jgi:hypothetical protein